LKVENLKALAPASTIAAMYRRRRRAQLSVEGEVDARLGAGFNGLLPNPVAVAD